MKKMKNKLPIAGCRLPVEKPEGSRRFFQMENRKSKIENGFTLVELLVVISIIGILAGFTVPVLSAVKRHQYISNTQAEMGQLQAAIDSYHATYGFYPPSNPNGVVDSTGHLLGNQLYYELVGTLLTNNVFETLDGGVQILTNDVSTVFSLGGFINCTKPGASEDSKPAINFIHELKPNQTGTVSNANNTVQFTILLGSVGGPDSTYQPMKASGLNPWRYVSPGVNNPTSYDLWIQLVIGGKTNLICNWSKEVQINNPLP
jgi:prepilin-type N-terminal cleavage/methylation domain-containing protein